MRGRSSRRFKNDTIVGNMFRGINNSNAPHLDLLVNNMVKFDLNSNVFVDMFKGNNFRIKFLKSTETKLLLMLKRASSVSKLIKRNLILFITKLSKKSTKIVKKAMVGLKRKFGSALYSKIRLKQIMSPLSKNTKILRKLRRRKYTQANIARCLQLLVPIAAMLKSKVRYNYCKSVIKSLYITPSMFSAFLKIINAFKRLEIIRSKLYVMCTTLAISMKLTLIKLKIPTKIKRLSTNNGVNGALNLNTAATRFSNKLDISLLRYVRKLTRKSKIIRLLSYSPKSFVKAEQQWFTLYNNKRSYNKKRYKYG